MNSCANCRASGTMMKTRVPLDESVGKIKFSTMIPAEKCTACGETFFSFNDLQKFDDLKRDALHGMGAIGRETMIKLRKGGAMTRLEVSQRLNVSLNDVIRWESEGQSEFGAEHVFELADLVSGHKILSPRLVNSEKDVLHVEIDFDEPEKSFVVDDVKKK